MNEQASFRNHGFSLVEALIAVFVLGVGVLGVSSLSGRLLRDTGESKIRTEALQIAHEKLEQARAKVGASGCDGLADEVEGPIARQSFIYTVDTSFDFQVDTDTPSMRTRADITVSVDLVDDKGGPINLATLKSLVNCHDVSGQALVGQNRNLGNFVKNPTGRATVGGPKYEDSVPGTLNYIGASQIEDGTKTNVRTPAEGEGVVELVDADGQVRLSFKKSACEIAEKVDVDFSTIWGKLFIAAKNGVPITNFMEDVNEGTTQDLYVLSSDASYCTVLAPEESWKIPSGATGSDIQYFWTYYQCYVGPEWWGNVGVVRTDSANSNDRVCVGDPDYDPDSTNSGTLFTAIPDLSNFRGYRGYTDLGNGVYESKGIGIVDNTSVDVCGYRAQDFGNHHLLLANITGGESCQTKESDLDGFENNILADNPGKFYCMSPPTCPDLTDPYVSNTFEITGTIFANNGAFLGSDSIDPESVCNSKTLTAVQDTVNSNITTSYTYTCTISWTGFVGESWFGLLKFNTNDSVTTLCPNDVSYSPVVVPETASVAYVINNRDAAVDSNAIKFTDVPMSVTQVTLDFSIDIEECGTLPMPDVSWSGESGAQPSLSWPSLAGEGITNYAVYTCQNDGNVSPTFCEPSIRSVTSDNSYVFSGVSVFPKKTTVCIGVHSISTSDSSQESSAPTKCVHRYANGDYEFF